ncbi:Gtpase activating protein [Kickxella alabastrina]|uniref:Gtpase activating protein n=1 Tax=Kickxella alabastrina TaxID=61397 RepID=A0ACC1I717_9FUNG|nr:Gtpase activating protein [Kickxella alabastrina]
MDLSTNTNIGPRWASWNLGVFLCIRCGGFHRHIGTHITKVKSINLDNWTPEQMEHFGRIGNKRANAYFNPHPEQHTAPRSDRDIERYIRDKYEHRRFVDHRNGVADPTTADGQSGRPMSPQQQSPSTSNEASALTRLREMGFVNVRDNHAALKRFSFNVDASAAYLRGEAPTPQINAADYRVQQLLNMGFDHIGQNIRALELCAGDVHRAIELLLSNNPPPRSSASPAAPSPRVATPPTQAQKPSAAPANLLSDDFFGASPVMSPPQPNAAANLSDMFGGLSMATASAPAVAAKSHDPFGDFGDFLSATPSATLAPAPAPAPATIPSVATAPGTVSTIAPQAAISSPTSQGGQSMFNNAFIMSLYSKAPASSGTQPQAPSTTTPKSPSNADAFGGLDFFM